VELDVRSGIDGYHLALPLPRTIRDYEHLPASHEAMIRWAMIALMTRCLARSTQ